MLQISEHENLLIPTVKKLRGATKYGHSHSARAKAIPLFRLACGTPRGCGVWVRESQ